MGLVERLLRLLEIDSVIGNEAEICRFFCEQLDRCADSYSYERIGNSLAVRPKERRCESLVALVGHLDTVPPSAENPPRVEGDRIYGLGSADMKSGLALMWQLLEEPLERPAYDLAFLFYEAEEGPYAQNGLGPLMARASWIADEADLAICLEPTDNVLQLGCVGSLHGRVTFEGRAAHSARPWEGDNAIHKAGRFLSLLAAREPVEVSVGEMTFREVFSATLAEGGTARNMVPDRFRLNVNFRFAPGRTEESARRRLQEFVSGDALVEIVDLAPAGAVPGDDNALLARFRRRCPVRVAPKQAWTDVARLSAAGLDAVNFGPGEGDQAHQARESTSSTQLEEGARLLSRFLEQD